MSTVPLSHCQRTPVPRAVPSCLRRGRRLHREADRRWRRLRQLVPTVPVRGQVLRVGRRHRAAALPRLPQLVPRRPLHEHGRRHRPRQLAVHGAVVDQQQKGDHVSSCTVLSECLPSSGTTYVPTRFNSIPNLSLNSLPNGHVAPPLLASLMLGWGSIFRICPTQFLPGSNTPVYK